MASISKISGKLFQRSIQICKHSKSHFTSGANISPRLRKLGTTVALVTAGGAAAIALAAPAIATELELHPPKLPWSHKGTIASYDHASLRRGYQVYREVCAACHSMKFLYYRHMIGVTHTEDEIKAIAAETQILDGPNDDGEMFERPGRPADVFPDPYENEIKARLANNGALPPDLSYVVPARHGGEDYIFHLLTSYCDAPAGVKVADGQYYNPYFTGGATSMARALYEELIEYEDGTPATTSQMAKDVSIFLTWASDPHHDTRKRYVIKVLGGLIIATGIAWFWNRKIWTYLKTTKIAYKNRKPPRQF